MSLVLAALAAATAACSASDGGGGTQVVPVPPVDQPGPGIDFSGHAVPPVSRPLPLISSMGGSVIASPRVVPIFFPGDAREATVMPFFAELPGSEYWKSTTSEYGAADLQVADPVHLKTWLPATVQYDQFRTWLSSQASGPDFPAFDPGSVYVVYLPQYVVLRTPTGRTCVDFDTFHGELTMGGGQKAAFAVVASCVISPDTADTLTRRSSSVLVKTVTNPFVESAPAYSIPDDRGVGWALGLGSEVADRCAKEPAGSLGSFAVARSWSNASATAGHDPCLPAAPGAYFNVEPVFPDTMSFPFQGQTIEAKTVKVGLGETRTIDVESFADGQVEWTLEAKDEKELAGRGPDLKLTFDATTTAPGRVRHLTIERVRETASGSTAFVISSKANGVTHSWWGIVAN